MPARKPRPDTATGSEAAFKRYLPLAQKLTEAEIFPYRLSPVLAYHNVQVGITAITPLVDVLKPALPKLDWKGLLALPELAQAVIFAATQVEGPVRSNGELAARRAEAGELRALLLGTAGALVLGGVFPEAAVAKIRRGQGPIDQARDCIELAALYRKHPGAMKQQGLVTDAHLQQASTLGTELLGRLNPGRARGRKTLADPKAAGATAARDRLATLLWLKHRELRRAGYYHWGDDLDEHVPSLQTGRTKARKKKPEPAPGPTG